MTISFAIPLNIEIRTSGEREIAMNLIQKLSGALEEAPEESRLVMLIEAIEAWDNKHRQPAVENSGPLAWIPSLIARD